MDASGIHRGLAKGPAFGAPDGTWLRRCFWVIGRTSRLPCRPKSRIVSLAHRCRHEDRPGTPIEWLPLQGRPLAEWKILFSSGEYALRAGHFPARKSAQTDPLPDFVEWIQSDCPTGKSPDSCPASLAKIFSFVPDPNQFTESCRPVPQRGVRTSRTRGGMRWTRQRQAMSGDGGAGRLRPVS
jgi:hypothetical protein